MGQCSISRIVVFKSVGRQSSFASMLDHSWSTCGFPPDPGYFMGISAKSLTNPWCKSPLYAGPVTMPKGSWRRFLCIDFPTLLCPSGICSRIAHITGDLQLMCLTMWIILCTPLPVTLKFMLDWLDFCSANWAILVFIGLFDAWDLLEVKSVKSLCLLEILWLVCSALFLVRITPMRLVHGSAFPLWLNVFQVIFIKVT